MRGQKSKRNGKKPFEFVVGHHGVATFFLSISIRGKSSISQVFTSYTNSFDNYYIGNLTFHDRVLRMYL